MRLESDVTFAFCLGNEKLQEAMMDCEMKEGRCLMYSAQAAVGVEM